MSSCRCGYFPCEYVMFSTMYNIYIYNYRIVSAAMCREYTLLARLMYEVSLPGINLLQSITGSCMPDNGRG